MPTFSRAPRVRAERTILVTRVAMAVYALFAIWLDPAEPAAEKNAQRDELNANLAGLEELWVIIQ